VRVGRPRLACVPAMDAVETLASIIGRFGYPLIVAGVMAENMGVPLPGEVFVILASSMVGKGNLTLTGIALAATLGAWTGDHLSFLMGRKAGSRLIDLYCRVTVCSRECSLLGQRFYRKYGPLTLVFARYIVGVRALAVPIAGMSGVPYQRFALFDLAGSLLWAVSMTFMGDLLGRKLIVWMVVNRHASEIASAVFLLTLIIIPCYKLWKVRRFGQARLNKRAGDSPIQNAPPPSDEDVTAMPESIEAPRSSSKP
jgi:membrane protein DedA with SNARE-associated domain